MSLEFFINTCFIPTAAGVTEVADEDEVGLAILLTGNERKFVIID